MNLTVGGRPAPTITRNGHCCQGGVCHFADWHNTKKGGNLCPQSIIKICKNQGILYTFSDAADL